MRQISALALRSKKVMYLPTREEVRRRSRAIAAAIGLSAASLAGLCGIASAPAARAQGADVSQEELMAGEALPDLALGAKDAPVTIVEYASMTCAHCAAFYATAFQDLKAKYIDTGKVRFVLREFPLDPLATAGFMLARCAGDDKRNAVVDLLFAQQKNWMSSSKPVEALASLLKQTGMSQKSFDACLNDQNLLEKVMKVHDRAADKFGVTATPTFFINGKRQRGEITPAELDKLIEPFLKG
jgi:protein-disulfide isomerase